MTFRLVLLRHGQSIFNVEQRFAGSTDVELTELGVAQARAAGVLLRAEHFQFDLVYTSELQRARRTAEEALATLGADGIEVRRTWRLNERQFGDLEGMRFTEAAAVFGPQWGQSWLWGLKPPGGEAMEDVAARVEPLLRDEILPAVAAGRHPLLVSHGNTIRVLDALLRRGAGTELEMISTATPLVYQLEKDLDQWSVAGRRFLVSSS